MLDIKLIRENPEKINELLKQRESQIKQSSRLDNIVLEKLLSEKIISDEDFVFKRRIVNLEILKYYYLDSESNSVKDSQEQKEILKSLVPNDFISLYIKVNREELTELLKQSIYEFYCANINNLTEEEK